MKLSSPKILPVLVLALQPLGAYEPQSPYLQQPGTILPYLDESVRFWVAAWDPVDQAFFSEVGATGAPLSQNKAFLAQTRNAYAFSRAFMASGDTDFLPYADGALRYLYDMGWDAVNGGWWGQRNVDGSINTGVWYNDSRWSFWQHYMLLGTSTYIEATGDAFHQEWLDRGNAINDTQLWDARPGYEGYYSDAALDWSTKTGKGFTPTVDAITTSALTNYLMTRDPARKERLLVLADNITDKMVNPPHGHVVSFPSDYTKDWVVNKGTASTSIGHHYKTAWCLARAYIIGADPKHKAAAEKLMDQAWSHRDSRGNGIWIPAAGVMRGSVNVFTGVVSGTADWWSVEQGFTGGIINWYVSRKPEYLEMADRSLDFFMKYYYDRQNGEVFSVVNSAGVVTDATKGQMFKAGYHSNELFYLVYVYGNLYYHNRPVTLHYRFEPAAQERVIRLWPEAYEDERLIVTAVTRDGQPHAAFDPYTRALTLPAGQGGVYAVTFESRYHTNPPAHHDDAWWQDWFGWFWLDREAYPWVYHESLGWSYAFGHDKARQGWFYNAAGGYYFYTAASVYPWIYRVDTGWVRASNLE